MKKVLVMFAVVAFLFSMDINAQEPKAKKKEVKTEKSCSTSEKKACTAGEKKGGCCASKKA